MYIHMTPNHQVAQDPLITIFSGIIYSIQVIRQCLGVRVILFEFYLNLFRSRYVYSHDPNHPVAQDPLLTISVSILDSIQVHWQCLGVRAILFEFYVNLFRSGYLYSHETKPPGRCRKRIQQPYHPS